MTTYTAPASFSEIPALRFWIERLTKPQPLHLEKAIAEVNAMGHFIDKHWNEIDSETKHLFRVTLAGDYPRNGFHRLVGDAADRISSWFNMTFYRESAEMFENLLEAVVMLARERIAEDVWKETLADKDIVEGAKRAREEIQQGKTVTWEP